MQDEKLMQTRPLDVWVPDLHGVPVKPRQRVRTPLEEAILRNQVRDWLEERVIERCEMQPLINNLVFVPKKTGSTRVCIDCTPVNKHTEDYDWALPRLQDIRHRVLGSRYMTRLDLRAAFFRIKIPRNARQWVAFTCDGRCYWFRRMPFGLKTAPSIFQQFMDTSLAELATFSLWYIDDIWIGAETLPLLRERTRRVKKRLQSIGCVVNEEKSEYEKQSLLFAGLRLSYQVIGPDTDKVAEIFRTPPPTTKKDMQSALGLVSYLRDFIPLTAHFTSELYPDGQGLKLSLDELRVHWAKLLRHIAACVTSLRHWNEKQDADLYADASGTAVGIILVQDGRMVAVSSRKLSPAETRYNTTDREHLALMEAAKKYKVFIHRSPAVTRVHSDHAALLNRKFENMTHRQCRWKTIVDQWIPHVRHVPGIKNPADYFSRWKVEIEGGQIKL
jgi:hypothetical protein